MGSIAVYLRERFKTAAASSLALGTSIWLVAVSSPSLKGLREIALTAVIAVAFLAFLLRQRVMDEFKDRGHDDLNYPNRPLQRGAITAKTLLSLGVVALALEIFAVATAAAISGQPASVLAYLAVFGFSLLTAFEFFVPRWLNRHFTVYFVSHQAIFVLFSLWVMAIFATVESPKAWTGAAAFILGMASLEIMRKYEIRLNSQGEVVPDTYLSVWGRRATLSILVLIFVVCGLIFALLKGWLLAAICVFFAATILTVRKSDRAVQAAIFLGFFTVGLVFYLL